MFFPPLSISEERREGVLEDLVRRNVLDKDLTARPGEPGIDL